MSDPVIHWVGEEFDERNTVLHLSLGVVSSFRRWNRILRDHAGDSATQPTTDGTERPAAALDPGSRDPAVDPLPFTLAVLGLVSVSERLFSHLNAARTPSPSSSRPRARSAARPDVLPAGTLR